ncbi:MAG: rane protein [Flavipsychrobacter sp.]|nr:rane protein [Flavipsychrobacter sp.]
MINYNTNEKIRDLFQLRKADTVRKLLPLIILVCAYSALVVYVERIGLQLPETSPLKHFTTFHTLLGFVISMLLVFRTNTAYDRWWEGRRQWGSLVNCSRNMAIKVNGYLPDEDFRNRDFFKKIIPLFASALRKHLQAETTRLALDTEPHPEIPDFDTTRHLPSQVAVVISSKLTRLNKEGTISGEQLININADFTTLMDVCGACERIKNTPIPFSYRAFIKKFIFLYIITLPFGLAFTLHYMTVPIVGLAFYVLASLELIAEEIEDPFGKDDNDLPMEKMAGNIKKNVEDIIYTNR